jgi:hypothetical protein
MDFETVRVATNLGPFLSPGETVEALVNAPARAVSVNAVTDRRGIIVRTMPTIAIEDEFNLRDVLRVRAAEDDVSHCVHIWLVDDGFWIMRTASQQEAERLADAIAETSTAADH